MASYQVLRHSGRCDAQFRVVIDTDDHEKAREKYEEISIGLRQGAVRFVRHGVIANSTVAPRLRTRARRKPLYQDVIVLPWRKTV